MDERRTFELRRQSDDLVSPFDRLTRADEKLACKRWHGNFWITEREGWMGVASDETGGSCLGRPWNVLPRDHGDHRPEGGRMGRKGTKFYIHRLVDVMRSG